MGHFFCPVSVYFHQPNPMKNAHWVVQFVLPFSVPSKCLLPISQSCLRDHQYCPWYLWHVDKPRQIGRAHV